MLTLWFTLPALRYDRKYDSHAFTVMIDPWSCNLIHEGKMKSAGLYNARVSRPLSCNLHGGGCTSTAKCVKDTQCCGWVGAILRATCVANHHFEKGKPQIVYCHLCAVGACSLTQSLHQPCTCSRQDTEFTFLPQAGSPVTFYNRRS